MTLSKKVNPVRVSRRKLVLEAILSAEVIIPSYNRIPTLQKTLQQIRTLYPDLQICLGLQGQVPLAFQEQMNRDPRVRLVHMAGPGTTPALNKCISTSEAEVVLILDDDAAPHFGWLESHLSAFAHDPALAYTAGREVRSSKGKSSFSEWIRIMVEWFFGMFLGKEKKLNGRIVGWINRLGLIFGNFDQPGTCFINAPRGCNMAIQKETFLKIGGFGDTYRGNAWGFEADFGVRLAKAGKYGRYVGDAIVIHHEVPSGGSRQAGKFQWFKDYLHNHKILISSLGPQAWLGSLPRLLKKIVWLLMRQ